MLIGYTAYPERSISMFEHVKWMLIEWLIDHRVLAVARCRAGQGRPDAYRSRRR